ncbi:MAG: hotdog domain-containing protein [Bacteroidota bacterium]
MQPNKLNTNGSKSISELSAIHSFIVFPEDLNYAGTLFGGKVLAEMDLSAAKVTRRLLYGTDCDGAVTASLDKVDFRKPAHLGDIIEFKASIKQLGRTSIEIDVHVSKENQTGQIETICSASFVFVSLKDGKPYPHNCSFITPTLHTNKPA